MISAAGPGLRWVGVGGLAGISVLVEPRVVICTLWALIKNAGPWRPVFSCSGRGLRPVGPDRHLRGAQPSTGSTSRCHVRGASSASTSRMLAAVAGPSGCIAELSSIGKPVSGSTCGSQVRQMTWQEPWISKTTWACADSQLSRSPRYQALSADQVAVGRAVVAAEVRQRSSSAPARGVPGIPGCFVPHHRPNARCCGAGRR
jgi:hypothetical protein